MNKELLASISDELQKQRRMLLQRVSANAEAFSTMTDTRESELEERAQEEQISSVLKHLDDREEDRIRDIDAALARLEAGEYGKCGNCGRVIDERRLRANPTAIFCADCSAKLEDNQTEENTEAPAAGRLPPDLELLDDQELQEHLLELVRQDGQVDMEELQIVARNGVIYLEGAVPSEPVHEVLLRLLTEVAGVQDVVDHLEMRRLAWERGDRSKDETDAAAQPGTSPRKEPYTGTEDPVLADEEGLNYEPPANPPPPPRRED